MVIYIPLLVCLAGGVVYLVTTSAKVGELARICFAVGLLVFLLGYAGHSVAVGR